MLFVFVVMLVYIEIGVIEVMVLEWVCKFGFKVDNGLVFFVFLVDGVFGGVFFGFGKNLVVNFFVIGYFVCLLFEGEWYVEIVFLIVSCIVFGFGFGSYCFEIYFNLKLYGVIFFIFKDVNVIDIKC